MLLFDFIAVSLNALWDIASETAQTYSSEISTRTLREVYVWPFQEAIRAGVGAVMCAYNRVNDQWACESDLLGHVLKDEV